MKFVLVIVKVKCLLLQNLKIESLLLYSIYEQQKEKKLFHNIIHIIRSNNIMTAYLK